jgi:hypothetical protein
MLGSGNIRVQCADNDNPVSAEMSGDTYDNGDPHEVAAFTCRTCNI